MKSANAVSKDMTRCRSLFTGADLLPHVNCFRLADDPPGTGGLILRRVFFEVVDHYGIDLSPAELQFQPE